VVVVRKAGGVVSAISTHAESSGQIGSHQGRVTPVDVPYDFAATQAMADWRKRLAWPVAYHETAAASCAVLRALVEVIGGYRDDVDMRDVLLLAAPIISSSSMPLVEAALQVQHEKAAGLRLMGRVPELDFLRGSGAEGRPLPRGTSAFRPVTLPRGLYWRRLARVKSWTPWHRLPLTMISPRAIAVSHNALLRDFALARGHRVGFHHAAALFQRIGPRGAPLGDPAQHVAAAQQVAAALSAVTGLDAAYRERLRLLIEDQALWVIGEAARDLAAVRGLRGVPVELWAGTGTYWPTRVLSLETLRRGGSITRFDHGGGTGLNEFRDVWNLTDLSVSSRYVVPTETIARRIEASPVLGELPVPRRVEIIGHTGDPLIAKTTGRPRVAPCGRRRVLYTPLPLLGFRQVVPAYLPDPVNLDWQMRVAAMLKALPVDFVCRPHPEGLLKGRQHPIAAIVEPSPIPFEKQVPETDVFVFDYVQSTTFYEALCTDRVIVLLDMGLPIFEPELRGAIERRCRVVPVRFNERNLPQVDPAALREAVCGGTDRGDPAEFRLYLLGEA
jgi:hypothetical protein